MKVWKQTKRRPAEFDKVPPLPEEMGYLWRWYKQLQNPDEVLTFTEIRNWAELVVTVKLLPFEAETLKRLDEIYRSCAR